MLSDQQRRQIMLANEGAALANCGGNSPEHVAEFQRCIIDGLANALIRLEGSEAAARYLFALTDRVVAGVRMPTVLPADAAPAIAGLKVEPAAARPPASGAPQQARPRTLLWPVVERLAFLPDWLAGFVAGLLVGLGSAIGG